VKGVTRIVRVLPGVVLCAALGALGLLVAAAEARWFGHPIVEGLVVVILLGVALRSRWTPTQPFVAGVVFTGKTLLEIAVCLLGVSVDLPLLLKSGPRLVIGIAFVVVAALGASFWLARWIGLPRKLAVLVACGNAICGNSAIVAVAPVIGAEGEQVASAITFTAILGVAMVLVLPWTLGPLGLSGYQYGVLAGLTVYAVPQVLAAAFPVSALAVQVATFVKLLRVLLLGPVVLFFAIRHRSRATVRTDVQWGRFVPWFIVGFLLLAVLRSTGALPGVAIDPSRTISSWLTVMAMAALGLGVDVRDLTRVGQSMLMSVSASLIVLFVLALSLIHLLSIH
jgi:uncharacterized integral membrane protein (TIGR00698 family)